MLCYFYLFIYLFLIEIFNKTITTEQKKVAHASLKQM